MSSYTPSAMITVLRNISEDYARRAPRAGMKQADMRYTADVLKAIIDVLVFIEQYRSAIEKAAKNTVPWRK